MIFNADEIKKLKSAKKTLAETGLRMFQAKIMLLRMVIYNSAEKNLSFPFYSRSSSQHILRGAKLTKQEIHARKLIKFIDNLFRFCKVLHL